MSRGALDRIGADGSIAVLCAVVTTATAGYNWRHYCPVDETETGARCLREVLEVPFVSRRERDLTRHSH